MAYEWCSVMCENQQCFEDRESLLLLSLEIGFHHLDTPSWRTDLRLTHTEHHRGLVDVVFGSSNGEAIADLLYAWTAESQHHGSAHAFLSICKEHLVDLHNRVSFSSRLRGLVIRSIEVLGYKWFEEVGVERFAGLLNHLHVTVEDTNDPFEWAELLLDALQSPEAVQHLSHHYWELLVELTVSIGGFGKELSYNPRITISLAKAQEWDKLECWIKTIWIAWPPQDEDDRTMEEDLERAMLMLFRQRPGAVETLTDWVGLSSVAFTLANGVPESFERILNQAREAAQQDLP